MHGFQHYAIIQTSDLSSIDFSQIGYGQGAVNNTNGFGKAPTNNTIDFGEVCADSWSPETNLVGGTSFSNTKSIELDGMDAYVSISANSNLQISDTFTISHWVKFTSTSQMYVTNFANKYGTYVQNGYAYLVFRNLSNTQITLQSTSTINDGNWHNIIVVKTTSTMAIYIDGVLDANNTNGATGITSTLSNAIGALFNGALPFEGTIDEVGVWNSDQSSNATAIGSTIPTDLSTYSPLSWWRCGDGDTAPTLTDNGSGSNDGTMNNFSTFSTDVPT